MKIFALALSLIIFCPTRKEKVPVFSSGDTIDYGTINYGTEQNRRTLVFSNIGEAPLILANVTSSCGCLAPVYYPKNPVLPGKSDSIVVQYDTKRLGVFSKTITITTNEIAGKDSEGNNIYQIHVAKVIGTVKEKQEK
jgi:hypothetical protein